MGKKEFNILLRKRVRFLTTTSGALAVIFFIALLLLWFFFLPVSGNSSSIEMKTAYYIIAVPEWVKYLTGIVIVGLFSTFLMYILRRKVPSVLSVYDDHLEIKAKRTSFSVPFEKIKTAYVNDLVNFKGESKLRFQMVIILRHSWLSFDDTSLGFMLLNYGDAEELINSLSGLDPQKFKFGSHKVDGMMDEI